MNRSANTMKRLSVLAPAIAAVLAAGVCGIAHVSAKTITSLDEVKLTTVTVNFEELKSKDKEVFGSEKVGQPYAQLGLVLPSQMIDAEANLGPKQMVGISSTGFSRVDNSNHQSIAFTQPQKLVAFTVKSEKATSILVTALDRNGVVLEQTMLSASPEARFIGFIFPDPKITVVRVVAQHATMADALSSPTLISGISFASLGDDGTASGVAGGPGSGGTTLDIGLASAVGATGGNASAVALAGTYGGNFGASGSGSAANTGAGRNVGNRNPNLPPSVIPEPMTLGVAGLTGTLMLTKRRRGQA